MTFDAKQLVRSPWRTAALALLAALFAVNVYRAATQSISHDEGVLFEWFLPGSFTQMLSVEHGNHHVLHDFLCKLTISLFGPSEFSLRLPALAGGAIYFYSIFLLCEFLFGAGFLFFLAVAFLSLNPFVLDYLCCARGYSLALGFFTYSLYRLTQYLAEKRAAFATARPARLLNWAGIALGLSIASNVIMIFPGLALSSAVIGILLGCAALDRQEPEAAAVKEKPGSARKERPRRARRSASSAVAVRGVGQAFLHFVVPAIAIGGFFSILPKRLIELEEGYLGPPSLSAILETLVRFSVVHSPWGIRGLAAVVPPDTLIRLGTMLLVPLCLAGLVGAAFWNVRRWSGLHDFDALPANDRFLLMIAIALPLTIVLIVVSRYGFDQPYPEMRTVMYWIPLLGLAAFALAQKLSRSKPAFLAVTVVLALCVVQFASQFNTRYFAEWIYCAAGRDMMATIRRQHEPGKTNVQAALSWQLEPVVNFYRVAWGLDWMNPVTRGSADIPADYYLLGFGDVGLVEQRNLKVLWKDPLSGTLLARR